MCHLSSNVIISQRFGLERERERAAQISRFLFCIWVEQEKIVSDVDLLTTRPSLLLMQICRNEYLWGMEVSVC